VAAWEAVRSDSSPENYCLFTYSEGSNSVITLLAVGSEGLEGVCSAARPEAVIFGVVRVVAAGHVKFVSLFFVGEDVVGMRKGRASLHKNAVLQLFDGLHAEVSAASTEDFTQEAALQRLVAALGTAELSF
jgi:hypothetical protein